MKKILRSEFFNRPTLTVARELIGKFLVRTIDGKETALMITETESYDGPPDLGSHSARGRTARTEVLFGPSGVWYVYLIYGIHDMLNVTTRRAGAAVLIRGLEGYPSPAKLTKALGITRALNKQPAVKSSGLWIEDRGVKVPSKRIERTPRIGIDYAGEWAKKEWRFVLTLEAQHKSSPKSERKV